MSEGFRGLAMRCLILSAVACVGCGRLEDPAKLKAEAEAARQETKAVRAEAEVARLKANEGVRTEKSFQRSPLEGKWVSTNKESHTFEFFPDGMFHEETWSMSTDGNYTVLDGNRVKVVAKEWLGESVKVFAWRIDGDKLTLEGGLYPLTLNRK